MARTVQVFCRRYQHDNNLAKQVITVLHNANWTSLDKIYQFLRT